MTDHAAIIAAAGVAATPPPLATASRTDVLAYMERLRAAAALLEAHARRCTVEEAAAHAVAIRRARGMVRRDRTSEEGRYGHE